MCPNSTNASARASRCAGRSIVPSAAEAREEPRSASLAGVPARSPPTPAPPPAGTAALAVASVAVGSGSASREETTARTVSSMSFFVSFHTKWNVFRDTRSARASRCSGASLCFGLAASSASRASFECAEARESTLEMAPKPSDKLCPISRADSSAPHTRCTPTPWAPSSLLVACTYTYPRQLSIGSPKFAFFRVAASSRAFARKAARPASPPEV
mmetsp:Transcript_6151/g.16100  ORF Transcript_6151/g.16100 Transcript_6151/m.16100 type:complete len:215 (+) Transcript_6151:470-1114(+)